MKRTVLAAALTASVTATAATSEQGATMAPEVITQGTAMASAPDNGLVFGILLVGLLAVIADSGASINTLPSDERLKTDIRKVGVSDQGFTIYQFRYKGHPELMEGVMAQEVRKQRPDAIVQHESGYLMVDYAKLDVAPRIVR